MNQQQFIEMFKMHMSILLRGNIYAIGFRSRTISLDARELLDKLSKKTGIHMQNLAMDIVDTVVKKNKDYSSQEDAFANFRLAEKELGVSTSNAIKIRMLDKIARLDNLTTDDEGFDKKPEVEDERVEDTMKDLIAYMVIEHIYSNPDPFAIK